MNLKSCKLYGMKRKRDVFCLLGIKDKKDIKNMSNKYTPYLENSSKKRLIEPTISENLKRIQKRIQALLKEIEYDENVFSGVPGKSYIDNGKMHIGSKYVVAIDINKFFPNIGREKVYNFFKNDMKNSSDVAKILTDMCTVDLIKINNLQVEILEYIQSNRIRFMNHIPTGSPISCILSYLVNYKMFDMINEIARNNNCKCSIYVDDIVISSNKKICKHVVDKIIATITSNGYKIQRKKLKYYGLNEFKRITGTVLSKEGNKLVIPNKIRYRLLKLKRNKVISEDTKSNKLRGYKQVINQMTI